MDYSHGLISVWENNSLYLWYITSDSSFK